MINGERSPKKIKALEFVIRPQDKPLIIDGTPVVETEVRVTHEDNESAYFRVDSFRRNEDAQTISIKLARANHQDTPQVSESDLLSAKEVELAEGLAIRSTTKGEPGVLIFGPFYRMPHSVEEFQKNYPEWGLASMTFTPLEYIKDDLDTPQIVRNSKQQGEKIDLLNYKEMEIKY